MVFASGVGYYGSNLDGSKPVTEDDPKGTGFLSEVAADSEAEIAPAEAAGIRTVVLRSGVVLTRTGGALGATPCRQSCVRVCVCVHADSDSSRSYSYCPSLCRTHAAAV